MTLGTIIGLVVAGVLIFMIVNIYNSLVRLQNQFKNAFAQIDVQLKRRYDLVPNLVETAKGYLKHERETLEAVIQARTGAITAEKKAASDPTDAKAIKDLAKADSQLSGSLGRLLAVFEQYPDLKANENMRQLMEELSSTENRISFARQHYNDSVMTYNTTREVFPNVIFAGSFGFQPAELFEVESAEERKNIQVSFS